MDEWRRGCKVHGRGGVEGTWTDSCNLRPHQRKSQVGHGIAKEGFLGENRISWELLQLKTQITRSPGLQNILSPVFS